MPLPGNPSRQTCMHPPLLPKGRNSQFMHVVGTSTSLLQNLSHVRSQKSTYTGKLRHALQLWLQSCSAQTRQCRGPTATPAQEDPSTVSLSDLLPDQIGILDLTSLHSRMSGTHLFLNILMLLTDTRKGNDVEVLL